MTDVAPSRLALASEGDAHGAEDWEKAAAKVLRKARRLGPDDPDSVVWVRLTRTTLDGIGVPPLGVAGDLADVAATGQPGSAPYTRGRVAERPESGWDVRVQVDAAAPGTGDEGVLAELATGASSVWMRLGTGTASGAVASTLAGVPVDRAPVVLDAPADPVGAARAFTEWLAQQRVRPAAGTNLGGDPVGALVRARAGGGRTPPAGAADEARRAGADVADVVRGLVELAGRAGTLALVVDATAVHDRGASDAQELGYGLAVGAAYLRLVVDAGLGVDEALGLLEFRYAATADQFTTIAKLRAARRLWARVAQLSGAGPDASGQRQHAVTSRPMMTRYDPWVNMLRTTVAAFAAGVGGADAVTVLPFDSALGVPDAFGRRVARNTSAVLIAESHVAAVTDPAGGSYAVERLTEALARAGWAELGRIEESGGILAALGDGSLAARIDGVATGREDQVARRQRPLTGLTEFPNLGEALPEREPAPDPVPVRAYGQAFEAMRDRPPPNPVYLATMGSVAEHTARATFATNLLAAGGIAVVPAGPTREVADVIAAYSGQPVVCLAGPDSAYAQWGGRLVEALRTGGARHLILAGKPQGMAVDDSCALGVDALAFLTRTREQLS